MQRSHSYINHFSKGFKKYHELMPYRIKEILLVSGAYDAFIMEGDGLLSEKISQEYYGMSLAFPPPRLTRVDGAQKALQILEEKKFDLIIAMPRLLDMNVFTFGKMIKKANPRLPVILLTHSTHRLQDLIHQKQRASGIDQVFVWQGNTDILLAIIKWAEDRVNVRHDTKTAMVQVVIFVEDDPTYRSSLMPIIYREIVNQTRSVMEEGINPEHQLLKLRARPKLLVATNYEEALTLYEQYKPFLMTVISDTVYPRKGKMIGEAGGKLLSRIHKETPHLPLLLLSFRSENEELAQSIPAHFINKHSRSLHNEIKNFFIYNLGFGDFVFNLPSGEQVSRAKNLRSLEKLLPEIPADSLHYHVSQNHFSRWLMARSEIMLAMKFRSASAHDFKTIDEIRNYLVSNLRSLRTARQKGVVVRFNPTDYDPDAEFMKVGNGSMGGKARGLAFLSYMFRNNSHILEKYPDIEIFLPKTLVLTTEGFDQFISENHLEHLAKVDCPDEEIARQFLDTSFPQGITESLRQYLEQNTFPLAVRSSSLLEDNQFQPYAGLYSTYMIPNCDGNIEVRLQQAIKAIKLVFASAYFQGPKAYAQRTSRRIEEEKMAVLLQEVTGNNHQGNYYPDISGVAQSYNYYPLDYMKPEEGIVHIALGLGKTVVEGEKVLRFSPRYPQFLPHFSKVEDVLKNSQRHFFSLKMANCIDELSLREDSTLRKREICDAMDELPIKILCSTYVPEDQRIRDSFGVPGPKVLTFAPILKFNTFPLSEIITDLLHVGQKGIGGPVEIEFSINLNTGLPQKPQFSVLQIRPMANTKNQEEVTLTEKEIEDSLCFSTTTLGNGVTEGLTNIIYVKPDQFNNANTLLIAREISKYNALLKNENINYLLIGPGRWGSSDHWLGIPIAWNDISNAKAIVETALPKFKPDPSQGTHLFQNITTLGIQYLNVTSAGEDRINWDWLNGQKFIRETSYIRHVQLEQPLLVKVDGKRSKGAILHSI